MRLVLFVLLQVPFGLFAHYGGPGLLWRITSADSARWGYVLGTIHSKNGRAFTHVPRALRAMADCEAVFGELGPDATQGQEASMAARVMLPPGKSLSDLYSKRKYSRVQAALKEKLGFLAFMTNRIKPVYLVAMLSETASSSDSSQVLDEYLLHTGQALGKRTGGLETPEEQLAAIDAMPLDEQADMLYEAVTSKVLERDMERMLTAYEEEDLDAIAGLMKEGSSAAATERALVSDRNHVMAQRMDSLMTLAPTFFAVGAAHLPGGEGVLELLRRDGYRVEAVIE